MVDPNAYLLMLSEGFLDSWAIANAGDPGYSCCQEELVTNSVSSLNQRIDRVFFRGPFGVVGAALSGSNPSSRISNGLVTPWGSDHAGMSATLDVAPLAE